MLSLNSLNLLNQTLIHKKKLDISSLKNNTENDLILAILFIYSLKETFKDTSIFEFSATNLTDERIDFRFLNQNEQSLNIDYLDNYYVLQIKDLLNFHDKFWLYEMNDLFKKTKPVTNNQTLPSLDLTFNIEIERIDLNIRLVDILDILSKNVTLNSLFQKLDLEKVITHSPHAKQKNKI